MDADTIACRNNEVDRQYEALVDGSLAVITYDVSGKRIRFHHTTVPEALGGRGVGSALARFALDDARDRGLAIVPLCPFVTAYIQRHREYLPFVDKAHQAKFASRDGDPPA